MLKSYWPTKKKKTVQSDFEKWVGQLTLWQPPHTGIKKIKERFSANFLEKK